MELELNNPIDLASDAAIQLLDDAQGNILKGHGREHSVHLFLRLYDSPDAASSASEWIKTFAHDYVTSAGKQLSEAEDFRRLGSPGGLFANFFLSGKGYDRFGLFSPTDPPDLKFWNGMRESAAELGDPPATQWEAGYQEEIHAAILLAHDDESALNREAHRIVWEVRQFADIVASERGTTLRNHSDEPIEPFGYVDGRSQPLFLKGDIEREKNREDIRNDMEWRYDPSAPLNLVLRPDRYGMGGHSYGSHFVFRKLEQNVRGFKEATKRLAAHLGIEEKLAAAFVVGRFADGTPVMLRDTEGLINPVPNNFNYENDQQGLRCPFHAHIRKTNPRSQSGSHMEAERGRRIARRGIPYGNFSYRPGYESALDELPTKGVGLLFMCFQSDIETQFEFIQKQWANGTNHPVAEAGIDPLVGQSQAPTRPQRWPVEWGREYKRPFFFQDFVTLKGGEYFFAPSRSGLRNFRSRIP